MPRSRLIRGARIASMLRSSRLIALVSATNASAYPAVCASRVRLTGRTSAQRWSASAFSWWRANVECVVGAHLVSVELIRVIHRVHDAVLAHDLLREQNRRRPRHAARGDEH